MGWKVYILECRNGELYVGTSSDVCKRVEQHNKGLACKYTKYRHPVKLKYSEPCSDYTEARKRERQIKKYSRAKKIALIDQSNISHPVNGVRDPHQNLRF